MLAKVGAFTIVAPVRQRHIVLTKTLKAMEYYSLYFGSGAGTWLRFATLLQALQERDKFAARTHTSVKDWHIEQYFRGYWYSIN